jgi:ribosomal protein L18
MTRMARPSAHASTLSPEFKETGKIGSNKEAAEFVGKLIGERAVAKGVTEVTFDSRWLHLSRPRPGSGRRCPCPRA